MPLSLSLSSISLCLSLTLFSLSLFPSPSLSQLPIHYKVELNYLVFFFQKKIYF